MQASVVISTILWAMSLALVGLALCNPQSETEKMADTPMGVHLWCHYPRIRLLYGWGQCAGLAFVLGTAVHMIFLVHWWYVLIIAAALPVAKILAGIINIPIEYAYDRALSLYGALRFRRIIGTLLFLLAIILCW